MQPNDCSSPILPENGKFLLQRPSPPLRPSSHPFPRTVEVIPSKKKNKKKNTSEMFVENLVSWGVKELKMTMLEVHQENKPEQKWQDLLWVESFQPTFQSPFLNRTSLLRLAKHYLAALGLVACGIFSPLTRKPGPPALGVQSLSHWIPRENYIDFCLPYCWLWNFLSTAKAIFTCPFAFQLLTFYAVISFSMLFVLVYI